MGLFISPFQSLSLSLSLSLKMSTLDTYCVKIILATIKNPNLAKPDSHCFFELQEKKEPENRNDFINV